MNDYSSTVKWATGHTSLTIRQLAADQNAAPQCDCGSLLDAIADLPDPHEADYGIGGYEGGGN